MLTLEHPSANSDCSQAIELCSVAVALVEASIGKDVETNHEWPKIGEVAPDRKCDSTTGGLIQYLAYIQVGCKFKHFLKHERPCKC
jgi:hypothetical protein